MVYRCLCGLGYTNFAVRGNEPDVYDGGYYDHVRYASEAGRAAYLDHLKDFFLSGARGGTGRRLLDVGCATGDFVSWALRNDWVAEGIDLSESAVGIGLARGLPLRQCRIEDLAHSEAYYDTITLWDVLEHLADPAGALAILKERLAPGGVLMIKTISREALIDRMARVIHRASLGYVSGPLRRIYVPGHLYCYTRKTLRRMLDGGGWETGRIVGADTPAMALSGSRAFRIAFGLLALLQRWSASQYELMAECRRAF
ncbi:MAG: class I SAM-dependent methyltransferase [Planctomycetota bacterium]